MNEFQISQLFGIVIRDENYSHGVARAYWQKRFIILVVGSNANDLNRGVYDFIAYDSFREIIINNHPSSWTALKILDTVNMKMYTLPNGDKGLEVVTVGILPI